MRKMDFAAHFCCPTDWVPKLGGKIGYPSKIRLPNSATELAKKQKH